MNKRFGFGVTAFYYIYNPPPKHYSSKTSRAIPLIYNGMRLLLKLMV